MTRIIVYAAQAMKFNASPKYNHRAPLFAERAPVRSPCPIRTNAVVMPQNRHCPPAALAGKRGIHWIRSQRGKQAERSQLTRRHNPESAKRNVEHPENPDVALQPAYLSRHSAEQKWYCSPLTVLRKVVLAGTKVPQTGSRFSSPLIGTDGGRPCGIGEAGASDRSMSPIVFTISPITMRMKLIRKMMITR